jgi:hypothetical protein
MAKPNQDQNQGEGNREADRNYRQGATEFADTEEQHRAAREAGREVEQEDRAQESEGDDKLDENEEKAERFDDDEDR